MTPGGVMDDESRNPSPTKIAVGARYLAGLDGIRAFAVLFVLFFHVHPGEFPGGYTGVDIFFVLSGFLITGILVREWDRAGRVAFGRFYVRRALRLLPALLALAVLLCLAYAVVLPADERSDSILAVLAAVAYVTSPLAASGVDLGSMLHAWSLSVEEYFYLVWPLLLVVLLRWVGRRRAVIAVAAVSAIAIAYRLAAGFSDWSLERIYYAADTRAEQLLIGCLLAVVMIDRTFVPPMWVTMLGAAALCIFVVVPADTTASLYRHGGSTILALITATVIAGVVTHPMSRFGRFLSLRPLTWLGKRSYGVYLWHLPIIALVGRALPESVPTLPIVLVTTLVVAAFSFRYVEEPFLRMKGRFPSSRSQPSPDDARTVAAES